MKEKFNQLIVNILREFITSHNLDYLHTSQIRKYTFYNNALQNNILNKKSYINDFEKNISSFNIFEPISKFQWGLGTLHLITFKESLNIEVFNIFKDKFLNTQYEDLFFSSVTKIIPINYCILGQPWSIVKKILITKKLPSNGLPDMENSKLFFINLLNYIYEKDFNKSFITFCNLNKAFIKRVECQEYLKDLLTHISDNEQFEIFIKKDNHTFMIINNEFMTCRIYKTFLFSKFNNLVKDKKEPITKLLYLLSMLNEYTLEHSGIKNLFFVQEDEKFKELIIFIHFIHDINYSFEQYLMFLLEKYLENKITTSEELHKVNNFYFLNKKLIPKNLKQKTTKI